MISDLRSLGNELELRCDVCVVGAGAAGLAVAMELVGTPTRVVMLEAGGELLEPDSQALYAAHVSGHPFSGHMVGRFRCFGGTTTRWGGQALQLSRWDLEPRPWISGSGWPLEHEELVRHYPRATELLGLDALDYGAELARSLGGKLPPFDPGVLTPYFAKWSAQPNFATRYRDVVRRAMNVHLVLHANLTTIRLGDAGEVEALDARTLEGKRLTVFPRFVVLAAGGLENARLLLANRTQRTNGIGNERDLVGRFLQDHPGGRFGTVTARDEVALQQTFNVYHRGGTRYSVRFALPEVVQRREEVASASATLMFHPPAESSFESLKSAYRLMRSRRVGRELLAHVARGAADLANVARPLASFVRGRVYTPGATAVLYLSCEQEPDAESRVTLATDADALGMPRLNIHWRLSEGTGRTVRILARSVAREIDRLELGTVQLDDWLERGDWQVHLDDHYHHIGTTRMAISPAHGVVDPNCRVHSVPNLYVASSSVFPTGGFSNPTLTILALAVRLARHLSQLCSGAG